MPNMEKLLTGDLKKAFLHYLITSVAGMLIFAFYVMVDTLFIGRFLGSEGLAALNVALPIYGVLTGIGLLLGVGGAAAMSVSLGEDNRREVGALFSTAVSLAIVCVILFTFIGVAFHDQFIHLLGGSQVNTSMVKHYLLPLTIFSFSFIFTQVLTPFARHDGAPVLAMWSTIVGGLTNIALDALFILVFKWGMLGASLATAFSSLVSFAMLIRHVRQSELLRYKQGQVTWARIKRIAANGSASLVVELSASLVLFAYNLVLLSSLGEVGVAGYGVIANCSLIGLAIFSGVGQAVQPLASINHGAGLIHRSKAVLRLGLGISFSLGILFYGVGLFFPAAVTRFFVHATPELLDVTIYGMRLYFLAFLFSGLNVTLAAYYQSLEMRQKSLQISLLRGFILVLLGLFILPRYLGLAGVWLTMPAAEFLTLGYVVLKEWDGRKLWGLVVGPSRG